MFFLIFWGVGLGGWGFSSPKKGEDERISMHLLAHFQRSIWFVFKVNVPFES